MSELIASAWSSSAAIDELWSDTSLVRAMLRVEGALARGCATVGLVPPAAADAIAEAAARADPDPALLRRGVGESATPVIALVDELRRAVGPEHAAHVHRGATTQDVVDSAVVLVLRDCLAVIATELAGAAQAAAALADAHRATVMAGRTLMQQAAPTTFGLRAATWLDGLSDAYEQIGRVRDSRLQAQLGGAVGTLAAFGDATTAGRVVAAFATELDLGEPALPWQSGRLMHIDVAAALACAAAAAEKVALDVLLLSQTEVGEVRERAQPGRGGSSTLPQKRNQVGSIAARAAARWARQIAGAAVAAEAGELERSAGAWQLELPRSREMCSATHAAVAGVAGVLRHLEVDRERMAGNVGLEGGSILSEGVCAALAPTIGWMRAQRLAPAVIEAAADGVDAAVAHLAALEPPVHLSVAEVAELLDPAAHLGSAAALVERSLDRAAQRLADGGRGAGGGRGAS